MHDDLLNGYLHLGFVVVHWLIRSLGNTLVGGKSCGDRVLDLETESSVIVKSLSFEFHITVSLISPRKSLHDKLQALSFVDLQFAPTAWARFTSSWACNSFNFSLFSLFPQLMHVLVRTPLSPDTTCFLNYYRIGKIVIVCTKISKYTCKNQHKADIRTKHREEGATIKQGYHKYLHNMK